MNSACLHFRTELPEGSDGRLDLGALRGAPPSAKTGAKPAATAGHAAECAGCAAWAAGLIRLVGGLSGLERKSAPAELDGRVVAALQAGDRELRAVRAVEELSQAASPAQLADTVDDVVQRVLDESRVPQAAAPQVGAPAVLERLVREELAEPEKFMVRRVVSGLSRHPAPSVLDERVAALFQREQPAPRPRFALGSKRLAWASLAAAALLILSIDGLLDGEEAAPVATRQRPFEVVYARSVHDLAPMARGLVDDVSGGLLAARGL